jgi:hypothetical protein
LIERFIVGLSLRVAVYTAGFVLEAFLETPRCCDQPRRIEHPKKREIRASDPSRDPSIEDVEGDSSTRNCPSRRLW